MLTTNPIQLPLFAVEANQPPQQSWFDQMLNALAVETGPAWPDRFGRAMRKWLSAQSHQPIRTLSLFSGGGGLDIAFHDAGFDIVEMVEIEEQYGKTLRANALADKYLGAATVRCVDVRSYSPSPDLQVDFIIGGPPCQTFSAAGRRAAGVRGTNDPKGMLFREYIRILHMIKPHGFLFENVYGIIGANGGDSWRQIQDEFREAGYDIYWRILDAADYGVPQHRERLFIVGLQHGDDAYLFPYPTHGHDAITSRPYYTAGEALCGIDVSDAVSGIGGRYGHLIPDIPPGLNYSFYTQEMGHPNPVFSWRSKFSDFMYKADPDTPVRTIKAQGGQYTGPFSWHNRHFTVNELKRLQTFPDEYIIVGGRQVAIEQIGNSVPPQIGRILALSILHQVFGVILPFPMCYLPAEKQLGFRTRKRILTEQYLAKAKTALATMYHPLKASHLPTSAIRYITRSFGFNVTGAKGDSPVSVGYEQGEGCLRIHVKPYNDEHGTGDIAYCIHVTPSVGESWTLPWSEVRLQGESCVPAIFTALWKAFEELVASSYSIADLVQLSGYYQYTPRIRARLITEVGASTEWRVLQQVIAGSGIAGQLSASALAYLWHIDEAEVLALLRWLRTLGYEVRNHNTNPQIKEGDYLIPYAFPTLTPRSVQLRKKL